MSWKVAISATAADKNGVTRVELPANGKVAAVDSKAAYRLTLNPAKYGKNSPCNFGRTTEPETPFTERSASIVADYDAGPAPPLVEPAPRSVRLGQPASTVSQETKMFVGSARQVSLSPPPSRRLLSDDISR
jgi:hypothetical protein